MKITYLDDLKKLTDSIALKIKDQFIAKSNGDLDLEDIGNSISILTSRLNVIADSDDETLDQLSEIVAYIKENRDLIEAITTAKVSVSDIIDSLSSNAIDKPLSAKRGKILSELISSLNTKVTTSYATIAAVEDLKKSVSDGKELVADAITEKGVETAADATFATMAENIGQITTGDVVNLQESVTVKSSKTQFIKEPDPGYNGISQVVVEPVELTGFNMESFVTTDPEEAQVGMLSQNVGQTYDGISHVILSGVLVQSKTVYPSESEQIIEPDDGYGALGSVIVKASQAGSNQIYYSSNGNFKSVMDSLGTTPDMYTKNNFKCVAPSSIKAQVNRSYSDDTSSFSISATSSLVITYNNTTGVVSANFPQKSSTQHNVTVYSQKAIASGYFFSPSGAWGSEISAANMLETDEVELEDEFF